jgi:hypothetical protein
MPELHGRQRITALGAYPVCAVYRFEIPLRAMIAHSWCSTALYGAAGGMFDDGAGIDGFEFTAGSPVLAQRHIALDRSTVDMLRANACRYVHDIDDLLWAIPAANPGAAELTAGLLAKVDTALRLADLVTTSTEPLAAALERRGIPAVIIPNLLDPIDWPMMPKRSERSRLRVGWYGQRNVHAEDLRIIETVVAALDDEVDFVFYGDVPHALHARSEELESYPATPIELFPTMLATLDLDILLAPLATNAFNECKSNLRLLQAGMLGYAVIATDIEPHRTLPVTLVPNNPAAWIGAIRDRIGELEAVRTEGRSLRRAVHERYIIDAAWTERIFTTWTRQAPPGDAVRGES